jgi:chromosome segregation ATPase
MVKALKFVVVINLILGMVVVVMGFMSFSERNVLKAKSLELEQAAIQLADSMQWGGEVPWEEEDDRKTMSFSVSQPSAPEELSPLKQQLDELARFATQRMAQVNQTHNTLNQTSRTLADTQSTLRDRESDHTSALAQQDRLQNSLNETKSELASAQSDRSSLQANKSSLEGQVTAKTNQISDLDNTIASLEIDLESRTQQRDVASREYERIRRGAMGVNEEEGSTDIRGSTAMVLAVNPEWQYVVIDKGLADQIQNEYTAFVHRGRDYVGKVQVVRVEGDLAIAEIIPYSSVEPGIQPGDQIFF